MEEKTMQELQELQNLKEAGNLEETQNNRLVELESWLAAEKTAEEKSKEFQSAVAQKDHFRTKAEELEKELANWRNQKVESPSKPAVGIDAMEVANLSVVFNGLDTTERAKLVKEVRANGKEINSGTLEEAKKSEDFVLWQSSYQAKVAKEKAPTPETKMPGEGKPKSEIEILDEGRGTFEDFIKPNPEKTKVLEKTGLWKEPARNKNKIKLD